MPHSSFLSEICRFLLCRMNKDFSSPQMLDETFFSSMVLRNLNRKKTKPTNATKTVFVFAASKTLWGLRCDSKIINFLQKNLQWDHIWCLGQVHQRRGSSSGNATGLQSRSKIRYLKPETKSFQEDFP